MNLSMKQNMALGSVAVLGLALGQAQEIPDRPEKFYRRATIKFPRKGDLRNISPEGGPTNFLSLG